MSEMGEAAVGWLAGRLGEMEEALAALVEVNSYTENPEGGRKTGALLREMFALPGLFTEVVFSRRYADHLVFRSRGREGLPPVALVGHLDTVFPPGKFEGYRKDGTLRRGPGVLDMKGGLVVIAWALKALAASGGLEAPRPCGWWWCPTRRWAHPRARVSSGGPLGAPRPASSSSLAGREMPSSPGARAPAR
jgi:glutamate carboxypeptidase